MAQPSLATSTWSEVTIPCANKFMIRKNIHIQKANKFLLETNLTERKNLEVTTERLILPFTQSSRSRVKILSQRIDLSSQLIKSGILIHLSLRSTSSTGWEGAMWTKVCMRRVSTVITVTLTA